MIELILVMHFGNIHLCAAQEKSVSADPRILQQVETSDIAGLRRNGKVARCEAQLPWNSDGCNQAMHIMDIHRMP